MADTNNKNEFASKRNNWWIWTIVVVVVVFILLMVLGKRSIITADGDTPTNMDPAPMDLQDDPENEEPIRNNEQ